MKLTLEDFLNLIDDDPTYNLISTLAMKQSEEMTNEQLMDYHIRHLGALHRMQLRVYDDLYDRYCMELLSNPTELYELLVENEIINSD